MDGKEGEGEGRKKKRRGRKEEEEERETERVVQEMHRPLRAHSLAKS